MVKIDDIESDFLPEAPAEMTPEQQAIMRKLAIEKQNADTKQAQALLTYQTKESDRKAKTEVEAAKIMAQQMNSINDGKPEPQHDPFEQANRQAELALKGRAQQLKEAEAAFKAYDNQANRDSKESIEALKLVQTTGVHSEAMPYMDEQMKTMGPFLGPAARKSVKDGGAQKDPAEKGDDFGDMLDQMDADSADKIRLVQLALHLAAMSNGDRPTAH